MGLVLTRRGLLFGVVAAGLIGLRSADAVIARIYPLAEVIEGADTIVAARITARDPQRKTASLELARTLKGRPDWKTLTIRLSGGDTDSQLPVLSERLLPGRTVLLFCKSGKFTLGFVEGTWFRLAEPVKSAAPRQFVHLEVYLRRTFKGTSAELQRVVTDVLAGTAKAPAPDPAAKPGYGK